MKLLFILFFISFNYSLFSKEKEWVPIKKMPFELEKIIESIHWSQLEDVQKKDLKLYIGSIDYLISKIPRRELYFLTKSFMYKYFLSHPPLSLKKRESRNFYLSSEFTNINNYQISNEILPIGSWVLKSIKSDISKIKKSTHYKKFLIWLKTKKNETIQIKKIDKKLSLIIPWYLFFKNNNVKELNFEFQKNIINILKNLSIHLKSYYSLSVGFNQEWPKKFQLKNFALKDKIPLPPNKNIVNIIDSTLLKKSQEALPKPVNEWLPDDEDIISLQPNQRVKIRPEDLPKSKEDLPRPVDDWILEY